MTQPPASDAEVRAQLRRFIDENFLYLHPGVELADDEQFLERGVLDSLGFVELVEEVQQRYGVEVGDTDITEENFGSIAAIAGYVGRRRQ